MNRVNSHSDHGNEDSTVNIVVELLLLLLLRAPGIFPVIRPHCSTTYVDRPNDRVVWSVGLSVGLSVTLVSPAKAAEQIEIPFR